MKRPEAKTQGTVANLPFPDDDWVKRFPTVCAYMADVVYDDGTVRKPSVVTIREQDSLVLVSLTDHDLERGLYRTGQTVWEAFKALEKAANQPGADWRPWKQQKGGKGK